MELQKALEEYFHSKIDSITYAQNDIIVSIRNVGIYRLKLQENISGREFFTYAALTHLANNRFRNISHPVFYVPFIFENKIYYTFNYISGREGSIENMQDIRQCVALLAIMHKNADGFTYAKAQRLMNEFNNALDEEFRVDDISKYIRKDIGKLPELYSHRADELARYKKIASRKNNQFDYAYVAIADYYCEKASQLSKQLLTSGYNELVTYYNLKGTLCHKEFNAHNVIFGEHPYIVNFENCSIDLPVLDLANIIKRKMRKDKWNPQTAHSIINSYTKHRDLTQADINVLKIVLEYPQKLWRIVNKYYNSRRTWCEKSCMQKLEEVQDEKNGVIAVVNSL